MAYAPIFSYSVFTGDFYALHDDGSTRLLGTGYSGRGSDLNNPDAIRKVGQGPIPFGIWKIERAIPKHKKFGPIVFPLRCAFGECVGIRRSAFLIHGDNARGDRSASSGCIILNRELRLYIHKHWYDGCSLLVET